MLRSVRKHAFRDVNYDSTRTALLFWQISVSICQQQRHEFRYFFRLMIKIEENGILFVREYVDACAFFLFFLWAIRKIKNRKCFASRLCVELTVRKFDFYVTISISPKCKELKANFLFTSLFHHIGVGARNQGHPQH